MPVLVTAAHRPLARRLAARLLEEGGEVRAVAAGDVGSLRASGAFVATGDPDDEGLLEAAMADVHTVVHVPEGLVAEPSGQVDEARVVATAATNAGVRRLVTLSVPGAGASQAGALHRAFGRVERVLAEVPCPTVAVRTGLLDTPWLRDALVTAGLDGTAAATRIAPVRPDDLIELVAAFDRARGSASEGHLVVAADGPVTTTVAEHVAALGGGRVGRRLVGPAVRERLVDALAGPWTNRPGEALDGWEFAGIAPRGPG